MSVPLEEAVGRIAAELVMPCPPGIPFSVPGERITDAIAAYPMTGATGGFHVGGVADPALASLRVVAS